MKELITQESTLIHPHHHTCRYRIKFRAHFVEEFRRRRRWRIPAAACENVLIIQDVYLSNNQQRHLYYAVEQLFIRCPITHFQKEAPQQSLPSWYWNFRSSDSNNNSDKDDERGLSEILRCVAKVPILKFAQRHPSLNNSQDWVSIVLGETYRHFHISLVSAVLFAWK